MGNVSEAKREEFEVKREEFEVFLRTNLSDEIRPRWEIKSIYNKAREAYYDEDDATGKDFFDQFAERLIQNQDEDFLKYCALAIFVLRPWTMVNAEPWSGAAGCLCLKCCRVFCGWQVV